jgi:enoyl-CoA hydratase
MERHTVGDGGSGGFRTIEFGRQGRVVTVALNRPHVLNAYNVEMRDELFAALSAVHDDPTARVLILRGNGRAFSSGGDLREFGTAPSPLVGRWVRWRRDVWGLLSACPAVTIAAVHGHTAGSGLEMALLCDIILAADDATMFLPETSRAMIPGVGGTQTLPRAVGVGRALDMTLACSRVDAREARRIALVNRMVPRSELAHATEVLAEQMAALPRPAVLALKRAVSRGLDLALTDGLALERRLAAGVARAREVTSP